MIEEPVRSSNPVDCLHDLLSASGQICPRRDVRATGGISDTFQNPKQEGTSPHPTKLLNACFIAYRRALLSTCYFKLPMIKGSTATMALRGLKQSGPVLVLLQVLHRSGCISVHRVSMKHPTPASAAAEAFIFRSCQHGSFLPCKHVSVNSITRFSSS